MASNRTARRSVSDGGPEAGPSRLYHPALVPASAADAPGLSPQNLSGEAEVARFAVGLFSALAFLEAEGWPHRPSPAEWSLGPEGLPRWSAPDAPPYEVPPAPGHARLLHRLLGGKPARDGQAWPSLGGRGRLGAAWNGWMRRAQEEGEGPSACRELLLDLLDLAAPLGEAVRLPSAWGIGFRWRLTRGWRPGLQRASVRGASALRALLAHVPPGGGREGLRPVSLEAVQPFPFAGLEPLLKELLGGGDAAREWLRAHLPGESAALTERLAGLLASSPTGFALYPAGALDPSSARVLEEAARDLPRPLVLLGEGEAEVPVEVERVRLLWLTPVGEAWYLEHLTALEGGGGDRLLAALEALPPGEPRCGGSLLPPAPAPPSRPAAPLLGEGPADRPAGGAAGAGSHDPVSLLRKGRLAELLVSASEAGDDAAGLWRGILSALVGQAELALGALEGAGGGPSEGLRKLYLAWCHKALADPGKTLEFAAGALELPLDPYHRVQALLLAAHGSWLLGRREEAQERFDEAAARAPDADLAAQARCQRAAADLQDGEAERAAALLAEARALLPAAPEPYTSFLLDVWTSLALKRAGTFEESLAPLERAKYCAARHGLRSMEAWCDCEAGDTLRHLYRFDEALARLTRAADGARALGLGRLLEAARFNVAVCRAEGGDLAAAERTFESCASRAGAGEAPQHRAVDHYWLALVRFQRGEVPEALESCERGIAALGSHRDSEVFLPLLILRGDILLLTGQLRKLGHLLEQLEEAVRRGAETHDILSALALRRAAAAKGVGALHARDRKRAAELLPLCDPLSRASWHLAGAQEEEGLRELREAFGAAVEARSASTACRALWELAERKALPLLPEEDRRWLASFLARNRVRGPERGLLSLLSDPSEARRPEARTLPADLALLAAAERGSEEGAEAAMLRAGAGALCLVSPGQPGRWWGQAPPELRRAVFSAAGTAGELPLDGRVLLGCPGEGGLWAGFLRAGKGGFSEEEAALARLWARLLRPPRAPVEPEETHRSGLATRHLITCSPAMLPVLEKIRRAAAYEFPVLITGEPGVGKEACAQALHAASRRASKLLVPLNCANLTPTLAASLLFGHRRGSFTGADRDREGLVEAARGSSLFLDEVGEVPGEVQPGLLRFLQDGSYLPLGETRPRVSDARIIAATNRDLAAAIAEGRFRGDLFHRLNVIPIELPPLRRRPEDIPLLFDHFLKGAARQAGADVPEVEPAVLTRLTVYAWPGNVRELQNLAKHLLVACHGEGLVREAHLPEALLRPARNGAGPAALAEILREAERSALGAALQEAGGNLAAAARRLGITRQAMHAKMRRLGMNRS